MSGGIRNRIRRLAFCDRLLLLLIGGWMIVGVPANYMRVRGLAPATLQSWFLLTMMILWAAIAGVVVYSMIRHQRGPADYGFTFKIGGVASLALVAVIHVYLAISGKLVLSATDHFVLSALGAFMEELAMRVIAIDKLILLMDGVKAKAFWAILVSSAIWSAPHIASKSPGQLPGIFLFGLLFGYVYYKSRSILLPAWIHGVANAGYPGGILIAGSYCLISAVGCAIRHWSGHPADQESSKSLTV